MEFFYAEMKSVGVALTFKVKEDVTSTSLGIMRNFILIVCLVSPMGLLTSAFDTMKGLGKVVTVMKDPASSTEGVYFYSQAMLCEVDRNSSDYTEFLVCRDILTEKREVLNVFLEWWLPWMTDVTELDLDYEIEQYCAADTEKQSVMNKSLGKNWFEFQAGRCALRYKTEICITIDLVSGCILSNVGKWMIENNISEMD